MGKKFDHTKDHATVAGHPLICFEQDGCCFDANGDEVTAEQVAAVEQSAQVVEQADYIAQANQLADQNGVLRDQLSATQSELAAKEAALQEALQNSGTGTDLVDQLNARIEEEYVRAEEAIAELAERDATIADLTARIAAADAKITELQITINDAGYPDVPTETVKTTAELADALDLTEQQLNEGPQSQPGKGKGK